MKFKIDFTTLPSITVKCDVDDVEQYARNHCIQNGLDPAVGGPLPLQIVRVFDADDPRCIRCGYDGVWLSHNTRDYYCIQCDEWYADDDDNPAWTDTE